MRWDTWGEMCDFASVGHLTDLQPEGTFLDSDGNPVNRGDVGGVEMPGHFIEGDTLGLLIPTLEGLMIGRENDWIIRGVQGEFYPCKPDIFEATYEPVGGEEA